MRAIEGNRPRHLRARTFALISSGLLALSVLGTGSVLAARPNLVVTGNAAPGTIGDTATTALPTTVSTSDTVQFNATITNKDKSNVSQLYFTTSSLPAGATVSSISSPGRPTACSTTATPLCTFGTLRPGDSVGVTVIFTTPASTTQSVTTCPVGSNGTSATLSGHAPYFCVDLRWYANGFPTGGNNSHGDFFDWFDGAAFSGDAVDFHGRFVYLNGQKVVANGLTVSSSNRQGTQASVNDLNIPVTVQDGPGVARICTTGVITLGGGLHSGQSFDCSTLSSETSDVNVAQGNNVSLFAILIKFYQAPNNLKGSSPVALHQYTAPGGGLVTETITNQCQFTNGVPTTVPCLVIGSGAKQVTIWNIHNGKFNF